ncbi:uncharacterized protein MONBRDRAFT_32055 [Monosiga brevicollis MX1]|uniref:Nucleolar protein 6 n=1 Tax=Monosiga brevicollis TaxID=81824 RepID=A9UX35_MONBE|nr:uncharacterized protein MONBRDRAFT_32055 [Monosiga brevicollis MX1]EDQ90146.1 predicted protein [Monosiga brevicollis MX1]|eukprot:XP_001744913.1 hypothetical protein [Monosiga brevicollis MX1]
MGRNPVALFKKGRIDPHPRKPNKRPHRRGQAAPAEDAPVEPASKKSAVLQQEEDAGIVTGVNLPELPDIDPTDLKTDARPDEQDETDADGIANEEGGRAGMTAEEAQANQFKVTASAFRTSRELYAAPSREEMVELKQAQLLFKSNIFKMQLDEMLKQTQVKYHKLRTLKSHLQALKTHLEALPAIETPQLVPMDKGVQGVRVPLVLGQTEARELEYTIAAPTAVEVIGSLAAQTACKPCLQVDLAVTMPTSMFHNKDHLNNRYLVKRACFLAHLAAHLQSRPDVTDPRFEFLNEDPLKPILTYLPQIDGAASKWRVRLLPNIDASDLFKMSRLGPDRNCLRCARNASLLPVQPTEDDSDETATPRYNNAILEDCFLTSDHDAIDHYAQDERCTSFGPALNLLKLPREASSYQMFRKVISFLALQDWSSQVVRMKANAGAAAKSSGDEQGDEALADDATFLQAFDAVFLAPNGRVNLLARTTKAGRQLLQQEARVALAILDDDHVDGFQALFLSQQRAALAYDCIVRVRATSAVAAAYSAQVLNYGGHWHALVQSLVVALLTRALGDRLHLVVPSAKTTQPWALDQAPIDLSPSASADATLFSFGLRLDDANTERLIDLGPMSDDESAVAAFRDFWGAKSEMRRFQDSSIREAVVWDCAPSEACDVVKWIILHILQRHCKLEGQNVFVQHHSFRPVLGTGPNEPDQGRVATQHVNKRFGELASALRQLNLPLKIVGVEPVSATQRYTDPFPPPQEKAAHRSWAPALEVVLQLESSGRWPNDWTAIRHVKSAFYIKIANALDAARLRCRTTVTPAYVDVDYAGYVFRLVVRVDFERNLVKQRLEEAQLAQRQLRAAARDVPEELEEAIATYQPALIALNKSFVALPAHHAMVHSYHMAHASFGDACRLFKRWVACHMCSGHFEEEALELLMLHAYSVGSGLAPPGSAQAGFLRGLSVLAHHDFDADVLVVDPQGSLTQDQVATALREARESRAALPSIVIITPQDVSGTLFTSAGPGAPILNRLRVLAAQSLRFAGDALEDDSSLIGQQRGNILSIFETPTSDFDIVLQLKPARLVRSWQGLRRVLHGEQAGHGDDQVFKNLTSEAARKREVALLVEALSKEFGHLGLFFHDVYGGSCIALAFQPEAKVNRPFALADLQDAAPHEHGEEVSLNVGAVATFMQAICGDAVAIVTVQHTA